MLAALPHVAQACDACTGGKDPNIRPAINGAIFFMLGMVGLMASGLGLFVTYLVRRAKAAMPPHEELARMMSLPEEPNHV